MCFRVEQSQGFDFDRDFDISFDRQLSLLRTPIFLKNQSRQNVIWITLSARRFLAFERTERAQQEKKLLQNQVSECGTTILCCVVLYALLVCYTLMLEYCGDKHRYQTRVPTRAHLAS